MADRSRATPNRFDEARLLQDAGLRGPSQCPAGDARGCRRGWAIRWVRWPPITRWADVVLLAAVSSPAGGQNSAD